MRKQNINLVGILLFILVIIGIRLELASAQVSVAASLGRKTVVATTASCRDGSVVFGKRALLAEEVSDASLRLLEV